MTNEYRYTTTHSNLDASTEAFLLQALQRGELGKLYRRYVNAIKSTMQSCSDNFEVPHDQSFDNDEYVRLRERVATEEAFAGSIGQITDRAKYRLDLSLIVLNSPDLLSVNGDFDHDVIWRKTTEFGCQFHPLEPVHEDDFFEFGFTRKEYFYVESAGQIPIISQRLFCRPIRNDELQKLKDVLSGDYELAIEKETIEVPGE
jgi:hypothetical protein